MFSYAAVRRTVRRRVGLRGVALAGLAGFDVVWAASFADPATAQQFEVSSTSYVLVRLGAVTFPGHPLVPWAAVLGLVALLCLFQAPRDDDRLAFAGAIGVKLVLAVATLAAWPHAGWQVIRPAASYLTLAVLVAVSDLGLPLRVRE